MAVHPTPLALIAKRYRFLLWTVFSLLALLIRYPLLPHINNDTYTCLVPWYDYFVTHGRFQALADNFSNYTPPYTYLISLVTFLDFIPKIFAIKLISIVFDFIAAWLVYRIVRLKYSEGIWPILAYFVVLVAPTVFIESADWGQCDIIYTTCLLGFLFFIMREQPFKAMLFFSLGFAFKMQAMLIAPLILILVFRRKIPWLYLLLPIPVYLAAVLPAWLAGRPLMDLLLIYAEQADTYATLSMNAPNFYVFLSNTQFPFWVNFGLIFTTIVTLVFIAIGALSKIELTPTRIILAAALILALVPFVLPKMHERYFFPAGIFAIVLAFYLPRLKLVAFMLQTSTILSFIPFLVGFLPEEFPLVPFILPGFYFAVSLNLILLIWLFKTYLTEMIPRLEAKTEIQPALND